MELKTSNNSWQANCRELAAWAWDRLAIKRDRHGLYSPGGGAEWSFTPVTKEDLAAHFAGDLTLGLGVTSLEDRCLWVAWDMDHHVTDEATNQNLAYAIFLRDRLVELGFHPIVEDSDGKGGIHVWILFASPIPATTAHEFSKWAARDYADHGLATIECFPKNSTVQHTRAKCGNYVRTPGKHHKRNHWSRFYGVDGWLTAAKSVELLLSMTGDDAALIPVIPKDTKPPAPLYHPSPVQSGDRDESLAVDALGSISPEEYDEWLKIGQALHSAGDHMLGHWIDWSRGSEKYKDGYCEAKWKTFSRGGAVGLGTLFHLAQSSGWERPKRNYVRAGQPTGIMVNAESGEKQLDEELPHNAVELTLNEESVNDRVVELLADRGSIYDHNGILALIIDEQVDGEESRKTVHHLSLATLREVISSTCRFFTWEQTKEGKEYPLWQRTPKWCYDAVLARGHWERIRPIRGIVTSPVLRADGSILQSAGYDVASGLYVDLTETFPVISAGPTSEAVQRAVALLNDVVVDFPFRDAACRSAWLASLLTPLAREGYRGCTGPLFLFDANTRGSGKGLLADVSSLIVTGRTATRMTAPRDDEEFRKRITAIVGGSARIVLIDNLAGRFGCAALDAALTTPDWEDRRLGHSEMISAPLRFTWYATGNNVLLGADTARRVCHIRLVSPLENPEDRQGFQHPDIRGHIRKNRPALLAAALTILRGFIAAGRPDQRLKPWGSFEEWSTLVRDSIVWAGLADPGETRTELRATSDSEAGSLRQMLTAVAHVDQDSHGLRTSDMLKIANARDHGYAADDVEMMREAIEMFCSRPIVKASAQNLGNRLSHFRNRVVDQMAFNCTEKRGANYWYVQSTKGGPVGPVGPDSANLSARKKSDVHPTNKKGALGIGQNRSATSDRSATNPNIDWIEGSHL